MVVFTAFCIPVSAAPTSLEGKAWVLQSVGGRDASSLSADFKIEDGTVFGSDGCNRFNAPVVIDSGKAPQFRVLTERMASTKIACSDLADEISNAFVSEIGAVRSYKIVGSRLELRDAAGKVRLVYTRQPENLVGVKWSTIGINTGGALESSARVEAASLIFETSRVAKVSTGCAKLSVPYKLAGNRITFNIKRLGRSATCRNKSDVADVHDSMISALKRAHTWNRTGTFLEIHAVNGEILYQGNNSY